MYKSVWTPWCPGSRTKYWVSKTQVRRGLMGYIDISQNTRVGYFGNVEINQEYNVVAFQHLWRTRQVALMELLLIWVLLFRNSVQPLTQVCVLHQSPLLLIKGREWWAKPSLQLLQPQFPSLKGLASQGGKTFLSWSRPRIVISTVHPKIHCILERKWWKPSKQHGRPGGWVNNLISHWRSRACARPYRTLEDRKLGEWRSQCGIGWAQ